MHPISPIDAVQMVKFVPETNNRVAKANRYGVGHGQSHSGWYNTHYAEEAEARAAYEKQIELTRKIYGTPGYKWTGRYREVPIPSGDFFYGGLKFIPLKKDGTDGKTVYTIHLYTIRNIEDRIAAIKAALPGVEVT